MHTANIKRIRLFGAVIVLTSLYGCTTLSPIVEAKKNQETLLSRASYEQISPAIEKILVGDSRSKVLEIAKPKNEAGEYFNITESGQSKTLYFHNWPGVLTPFNSLGYLASPENLEVMHFGYLNGNILRPRRIIIFENDKVSKVIDVPDPTEMLKKTNLIVEETDPLAHFRKDAYEQIFLEKKNQIYPGLHLWEVFTLLGANYFMTHDAQYVVVMCPGYLNYKRAVKAEKTSDGVRSVYPFGYVENDTEIIKWELEMLNYRVVRVRQHVE